MTLRELLKKNHLEHSDKGIMVHDRGCDMAVSPRYLEGGWDEILDREVSLASKDGREYWLE